MQSWQLGSEFDEVGIIDEDDIGWEKHLKMGWKKDIDYYNQITREKAYIAFIKCYVPYKPKYELGEFSEIILTTLQKVKKVWDRCLPDGNMSTDIMYWVNLAKYYMNVKFENNVIDFSKTLWEKPEDDIMFNQNPIKLMKEIYKANIFTNWKTMDKISFVKNIRNVFKFRINPRNSKSDRLRYSKNIKLGIMLANLFKEEFILNELTNFLKYVNSNMSELKKYLRKEIHEYNKQIDMQKLMDYNYRLESDNNNKMKENYILNLKIYDMIVNKNMQY